MDALLFGESQSRIVVSCRPDDLAGLEALASERAVPLLPLGQVGGDRFRWGDGFNLSLEEVAYAWRNGLS
jgi:phosphoribosylformylglycinamidine synthase subunit PurL